MRVLVCGGRDYANWDKIRDTLDALHMKRDITHVITGASNGADSLADRWARWRAVAQTQFPARWLMHGKAAGPMRNKRMLDEGRPDLVVAFPGGKGTVDMIRQARAAGVPVEVVDDA